MLRRRSLLALGCNDGLVAAQQPACVFSPAILLLRLGKQHLGFGLVGDRSGALVRGARTVVLGPLAGGMYRCRVGVLVGGVDPAAAAQLLGDALLGSDRLGFIPRSGSRHLVHAPELLGSCLAPHSGRCTVASCDVQGRCSV